MKLKVPAKDAIDILSNRRSEIDYYDFDPVVWKGKTENDLKEIFDLGDFKWTQISQIKFTTVLTDKKNQVFENGKKQAKDFLASYIEQIEKYSEIQSREEKQSEKIFEEENIKLNLEISKLLHSSNILLEERNSYLEEINVKNEKINHLENNTVQLDKITLNKLFILIKNLPLGQTVGLLTTFFGIVGFSYFLGNMVKENTYLKEDYKKQQEIDSLKFKHKALEVENRKVNLELKKLKNNEIKQTVSK